MTDFPRFAAAIRDLNSDFPVAAQALGTSTLADLLRILGADPVDIAPAASYPVTMRRFDAGVTLFHEGNVADSIYIVSLGSFKCIRTAEDGYEQVLGFMRRGEVLGFDAICMGQHPTAAVALEDSRVFSIKVRDLFSLAQRVPALDKMLYMAASRQLTVRTEIADVMAAVAADVRLARFLVQLSEHMGACGQSSRRLLLRMSRSDIASYLGVAHATVSRSFSALAACGCIKVSNRDVEILDAARLKSFSRATRGLSDESGRVAGAHGLPPKVLGHWVNTGATA